MIYNPGDRVGDYQIISILGAGGMGKVYKVRNLITERVEAMKVLLPNLETDPDLADRFMREIKVQASLQHPNIAALHTAARINNQLLMLIEFVEGTTLEAELKKGRIAVDKAVDYIRQVLLALGYAHSHGVVHRDIKPANMMLTPGGSVKLMDFGIARLAADRRLTQTGQTVGSLYYMSPEQIQGAVDLDARSDLYSLGVSLYELVTARRPFQGDSDYSIMAAHLSSRPVPPIEVDPALPGALNEVILTAIAKTPTQRFQSADAFRYALESVANSLSTATSFATVVALPSHTASSIGSALPAPPSVVVQPPAPAHPAPQVVPAPAHVPVTPAAEIPKPQPPKPAPAPLPSPAVVAAPGSNRGLYMGLGSVVTVLALAVAALQGPRFFQSSSASTAGTQVQQPVRQDSPKHEDSRNAVSTPAAQTPEIQSAPPSGPLVPDNRSAASATGPLPGRAAQVLTSPKAPSRAAETAKPITTAQLQPQTAPAALNSAPPAQVSAPAVSMPIQSPPAAPSQTAPADQGRQEALRAHRELMVLLATRANAVRSGLTRMKQQQAQMGVGLRGDVATAEQRMDFYLQEADAALRSGDADRMKKNLASAERAIETIEQFLGR